jgi:RING finger/CHY zinc finger protein 1
VTHIKCLRCEEIQLKSPACTKCSKEFAKYFCDVCVFYDDKGKQKQIFHCEKCGICRVGGRENFFHCEVCGVCLSNIMKSDHKCIKERMALDCPVCLDDIYSSRDPTIFMLCGHPMH